MTTTSRKLPTHPTQSEFIDKLMKIVLRHKDGGTTYHQFVNDIEELAREARDAEEYVRSFADEYGFVLED